MAKDTGEERTIWPSPRRLLKLRRDGQVPLSRDFQSSLSMLAVVLYVTVFWRSMIARLQTGLLVVDPAMPGGFAEERARVLNALGKLTVEIVGPVLGMAIFGALLGALLDGRGFPLKVKDMAPDFARLSPTDGLERIFSLRSLLELIKGLLLIVVVIGANVLLFRALYNDLMWSPGCGVECSLRMFMFIIGGSVAIGLVAMLIAAFSDLPVSRWLFRRDNRMSISEFKRDQRDVEGDPEMRRERRKQGRQMVETSGNVGLHRASIVLTGGEAAVALTFVPGQTSAPVIAARTLTERKEFVRRAAEYGLPVTDEPALVLQLTQTGELGGYVPRPAFANVARVLINFGIIRA